MAVIAFVTYATVVRQRSDGLSIDLRHVARTDDGREIAVLCVRGFEMHASIGPMPDLTTADVEADVRACVGPDEPTAGQTADDAEAAHWRHVAGELFEQGISITPDEAKAVPHEVVFPDDPAEH